MDGAGLGRVHHGDSSTGSRGCSPLPPRHLTLAGGRLWDYGRILA